MTDDGEDWFRHRASEAPVKSKMERLRYNLAFVAPEAVDEYVGEWLDRGVCTTEEADTLRKEKLDNLSKDRDRETRHG